MNTSRNTAAKSRVIDLPRATGIYRFIHRITGDTYVGSAVDIRCRVVGHLGSIRRGDHPNRGMQALADEHGIASFSVEVVELCDPLSLYDRESDAILRLEPSLNRRMPPRSTTRLKRMVRRPRVHLFAAPILLTDAMVRKLRMLALDAGVRSWRQFAGRLLAQELATR